MMKSLTELMYGEQGIIKEIKGSCAMLNRLCALGIIPGKTITKVSAMALRGPVVIRINGTEVALGYGMAKRIFVEPVGWSKLIKEKLEPKILGLNKVAITVKDHEQAQRFFEELLGIKFTEKSDSSQKKYKVKSTQFGDTEFQIINDLPLQNELGNFIHSPGLHHIAFLVNSIDIWVKKLKEKNIRFIFNEPGSSEQGRSIFIHPEDAFGVLIELVERR
ncbi:MAG: FeoA domain-containing protein [candidate division WOR-3 bacterium]|nr:FeoA domain-containing protein [candidate division WOR-3 bacterium]